MEATQDKTGMEQDYRVPLDPSIIEIREGQHVQDSRELDPRTGMRPVSTPEEEAGITRAEAEEYGERLHAPGWQLETGAPSGGSSLTLQQTVTTDAQIYEAHDMAAHAAATAAALHFSADEPIRRAANTAEAALDAPGAVDWDCSVVSAPRTAFQEPYAVTDLASRPLTAPRVALSTDFGKQGSEQALHTLPSSFAAPSMSLVGDAVTGTPADADGSVGGVSDVQAIDELGEQCPPAVTLGGTFLGAHSGGEIAAVSSAWFGGRNKKTTATTTRPSAAAAKREGTAQVKEGMHRRQATPIPPARAMTMASFHDAPVLFAYSSAPSSPHAGARQPIPSRDVLTTWATQLEQGGQGCLAAVAEESPRSSKEHGSSTVSTSPDPNKPGPGSSSSSSSSSSRSSPLDAALAADLAPLGSSECEMVPARTATTTASTVTEQAMQAYSTQAQASSRGSKDSTSSGSSSPINVQGMPQVPVAVGAVPDPFFSASAGQWSEGEPPFPGPERALEDEPGAAQAGSDPASSTGLPMDFNEQRALHSVQQQIALRGYVSKAAAIAGAFVHLGQPVSRAANMAETAMDPADAVDFRHAVTNLQVADTIKDIQAAAAAVKAPSEAVPDPFLKPLLERVGDLSKAARQPGAPASTLPVAATNAPASGSSTEAGRMARQQQASFDEGARVSLEAWLRRARLFDSDLSPQADPVEASYAIQAAIQAGLPPPSTQFMNMAISYAQRDAIPREILQQHLDSGHTAAVAGELHALGEHVRDGVKDAEAASEMQRVHSLPPANNVDDMVAQVVRGDAPWQHTASLEKGYVAVPAAKLQRSSGPSLQASVSQPIPLPPAKPKQQLAHASASMHLRSRGTYARSAPSQGSARHHEAVMLHDKAAHQVAAAALHVAQGQHVSSAAHDAWEAAQLVAETDTEPAATSRAPAPTAAGHPSDSNPGTLLPEAVQMITKPVPERDEDSESREYWVGVLKDAAGVSISKECMGRNCHSPHPTPSSSRPNKKVTVPLTAEKRFLPEGERSLGHEELADTISCAAMRVLHDSCGSQAAQAAVHKATGELIRQAVEAIDLTPVQAANTSLQVGACFHSFQPSQHVDTSTQQQAQPRAALEAEREAEARLRRIAETAVCAEVDAQTRAVHEEAGRSAALAAQAVAVGELLGDVVDEIGELA